MSKWVVYGSAWFAMELDDAKSEADARIAALVKLMDLEGMKIEVRELEAEEADDGTEVSVRS